MVCANCGSESHRTGDFSCRNCCTLYALYEHRQKKKHVSVAAHAVEPAIPRANGPTELSAYATRAAKHAAAQSTETLGASNALSKCTKCKAAMGPKGHNRNDCPETLDTICTLCEGLGTTRSDAQRSRVLHAVVERTDFGRTLSVLNTYCTARGEKGRNRTHCPDIECATCCLF